MSLQYLKKEVRKGVHFLHADEQSFYKFGLLFLMEVTRCVQSTQSRKLVIFLERVLQLLLCTIVMQNNQIYYGGPALFIVIYLFPCTASLEIFCLNTIMQ